MEDEEVLYSEPGFSEETGHYTQVGVTGGGHHVASLHACELAVCVGASLFCVACCDEKRGMGWRMMLP